jgi:hypothetical protein
MFHPFRVNIVPVVDVIKDEKLYAHEKHIENAESNQYRMFLHIDEIVIADHQDKRKQHLRDIIQHEPRNRPPRMQPFTLYARQNHQRAYPQQQKVSGNKQQIVRIVRWQRHADKRYLDDTEYDDAGNNKFPDFQFIICLVHNPDFYR